MESFSRRIEPRPSSSTLGRLLDDPVNDSVEPALVETPSSSGSRAANAVHILEALQKS